MLPVPPLLSGRSLHALLGLALLGLLKVTGFQVRVESLGNIKVDTFLQLGLFCFMRIGFVALLWVVLS